MTQALDPKELKTLSDILALVLEDQPGQSASALEAIRQRARRNAVTGGALKNLFVAIAPNPPAPRTPARPRASRAAAGTAGAPELAAARTRISQLTADINKLDLDLRHATARIESMRAELTLTRQARAEAQQSLSQISRDSRPRTILMVLCVFCGVLIGIAGASVYEAVTPAAKTDTSSLLRP